MINGVTIKSYHSFGHHWLYLASTFPTLHSLGWYYEGFVWYLCTYCVQQKYWKGTNPLLDSSSWPLSLLFTFLPHVIRAKSCCPVRSLDVLMLSLLEHGTDSQQLFWMKAMHIWVRIIIGITIQAGEMRGGEEKKVVNDNYTCCCHILACCCFNGMSC